MATKRDRDERDEDDKDDAEETAEASAEKPAKAAGEAKKKAPASAKAKASAERDEEEDEEEDHGLGAGPGKDKAEEEDEEDEEEDEEEEAAAPAVAAKRPAAKPARGPGAARIRAGAPPNQGGSLGKSVALFFVIVIGLGAGFAILGKEAPQEAAKPKWKVGDVVDVEVTLVRSDRQDLGCSSAEEVAGKHCAFEAMNKPWTKGDVNDDKVILKPYTTTDRIQFTAAGLWSDPGMAADKLPATRFSVKCKYKVEGSLKSVGVRWEQTGNWFPNNDWYAGSISACKLAT